MNTLRVGGVPEHFNLPWLLAIESNAFATLGVEVTFRAFPGGTGAMAEALNTDEIDLALMLTEGAVLDVLRGGSHRLVRVFVDSPLVWGIHVPAGSDLVSPDAMAGRPVAISRFGSGSHLIAVVDALERGFDGSAMKFVTVGDLDGAREALSTGRAEVFLWERHMTQPLVDAGEFRRIGERVVPWPAFVACVRRDVIERDGDLVRRVLQRVAEEAGHLKRSKDGPRLVAERYGLAIEDAEAWLSDVRWSQGNARPDAALERVCSALGAQGALDGLPGGGMDGHEALPDPWATLPSMP